mmetsp:Transcript_36602/g.117531  ORF Transcript_36602/g.117531 Transcript_36602/m.117531 type:complete len:107 (-) Transcript_36602:151-471(-)
MNWATLMGWLTVVLDVTFFDELSGATRQSFACEYDVAHSFGRLDRGCSAPRACTHLFQEVRCRSVPCCSLSGRCVMKSKRSLLAFCLCSLSVALAVVVECWCVSSL